MASELFMTVPVPLESGEKYPLEKQQPGVKAMIKVGGQKYSRAMFLKERALEIVERHGVIERIGNAGVCRVRRGQGFSISYYDPESADCDEFYHLDVHANGSGKVFSVRWRGEDAPEVVTFKRGPWETFFLS